MKELTDWTDKKTKHRPNLLTETDKAQPNCNKTTLDRFDHWKHSEATIEIHIRSTKVKGCTIENETENKNTY